jgi:3-oxoacyl-[acyl-carrier protein] reductase
LKIGKRSKTSARFIYVWEDTMTAVQEKTIAISKKLQGKIALVTGGSRGIGAAIALRLAADGATVALSYVSNKAAADKVVAQITELGSKAIAVKADVSSKEDSDALIREIKKLGKIDILVNNAAIFIPSPIEAVDISVYDQLFDTNVKGVVSTTIAALPHMNDGGRIINISSGAARGRIAGFSLYSATKAALEALTRGWAQDLGKRQITVDAIAPGTTATDMLEKGLPEEAKQEFIAKTALGRLGEPADIADAVAFLASADGRWVTGQTLDCDGGLSF